MKDLKIKMKNSLTVGIAFFIIIITLTGSKVARTYSDGQKITLTITEADYGDFDNDGSEDDIIIKAIMKANFQGDYQAYIYLDITLPSGMVYKFSFQVMLSFYGDSSLEITITAYDTAIEAGWYECKLTSILIYEDMLIYSYSTYTFDPPTEKGPGQPTAEIAITSNE